jgi:hypothetical protein
VPLGALASSWWMVYLLLLVSAALPVVICDNLGRQTHSRYISMSVDRIINCHLVLKFWLWSDTVVTSHTYRWRTRPHLNPLAQGLLHAQPDIPLKSLHFVHIAY